MQRWVRQQAMTNRRRFVRRAAIRMGGLAGAASLLIGCGTKGSERDTSGAQTPVTEAAQLPAETPPKPGGELCEATIVQAPHFSPFHPGADPAYVNTWRRSYGYYDYLWTFKDANIPERMVLMLAETVEQPDETTVIVHLSPSNFHNRAPANGREVTAEDVVETLEFLSKPPASGGLFLQSGKDLRTINVVDESTVRFEMFGPRAFFYEELQGGTDTGKSIVPMEMLDEKTLKETIPVGSGPYEYQAHTQGSIEEVKRNATYRTAEQPYIDERKLTFLPDQAAIEAAFRANQIETIRFNDVKQKDAVGKDLGNKIVIETRPSTSGMALIVNINRDPWKDIRVREAIYRAIDVDRVINVVYFGDAERTWYFSKARFDRSPLGPEAVNDYISYDPKKATELLKAAGVDPNEQYEFMVPVEAQTWVDSARLIAEDLRAIGLRVWVNPVVRNIYLQRAGPQPGDFEISMSLLQDYRNATSNSGTYWNSSSLRDQEIDAMVSRIFETVDSDQRTRLSHEFEMTLARKYSNLIPIVSTKIHYGWYSYVKGVDPDFHPYNGLQAKRWLDK
ncbi:MAG: ABC transporter substrate-binding protein [Thermomicrobiales bacterium]